MKFAYLLATFWLAATAFADASSDMAAEYAVLYYWYAYVLEHEAELTAPKLIAPGCDFAGESPICYLDEWLRYIQTSGDGEVPWEGALEGMGDTMSDLLVDVDTAAKALLASGYSASVDAAKLLPSLFAEGASAAYTDILSGINSVIQTSRTTLVAAGTDITAYVAGLTKAMASNVQFRLQSQAGAQITAFVDWCTAKKCTFSIFVKTMTNPDGSTYQALDTDAMIAANPNLRATIVSGVQSFMKDYTGSTTWPGTTPPTSAQKVNFKAIQGSSDALSGVIDAPHC